jgi:eukaryotic-like serine/threonine-protein kinase
VSDPKPGDRVAAGKYCLERALARGGMGSVFVARHLGLDTLVAVKFIDPTLTTETDAQTRFEREARAAAQIRNRNVVQVFDHGVDNGLPYIVMELLEGEDLGKRLKRQKRVPLDEAASIMIQLANGLRRVHDLGIVHRDLKPGNIFMAHVEDEEVLKILDFGLAKAIAGDPTNDVTMTGMVIGSPQYMSPEHARGNRKLDHRSDLWSIGVILYRCVTGAMPFRGEQIVDVVVRVYTEPFPPPSSLDPDLPPELDRFFDRALAREPEQRFQSVREMALEFCAIVTKKFQVDLSPLSSGQFTTSLARLSSPSLLPKTAGADGAAEPQAAAPRPSESSLELPSATAPGTTVPLQNQRRLSQRRVLWVAAGAVVAAALGTASVLWTSSPPGSAAATATLAPESSEAAPSPATAAPAPSAPESLDPSDASEKAPAPETTADADAGTSSLDAGANTSTRPRKPIKKRRNFGY